MRVQCVCRLLDKHDCKKTRFKQQIRHTIASCKNRKKRVQKQLFRIAEKMNEKVMKGDKSVNEMSEITKFRHKG